MGYLKFHGENKTNIVGLQNSGVKKELPTLNCKLVQISAFRRKKTKTLENLWKGFCDPLTSGKVISEAQRC